MASSKEYLAYILEQLSGLEDIRYRAMMGEYILYYREKVVGGIYDDRFLIKNVTSARESMPDASLEKPYEGAKEMILVENVEDRKRNNAWRRTSLFWMISRHSFESIK